jgi:lyso-ornithine lipid O-acyltransferase
MDKARAYLKILLFALWSILLVSAQTLVLLVHQGPWAYKIPRLWHIGLCWVFGLKVRVIGAPISTKTPVMFISNHASYLDILAMGTQIEASFVSKNDLASWPIFGYISRMQQTAYISRASKDALKERHSLQSYLKAGKSIILFPEGTTNNGSMVLPFKSSLFALALDHHLTDGKLMVQPYTMRILPKSGPTGVFDANHYAWPFDDDTPMVTHLMRFAKGHGCILELIFHAPIDPKIYDDRKTLSKTCQFMVVNGLQTGLPQAIPAPETLPDHIHPTPQPEMLP